MSYIQKDLLEGEHIVYQGKLHWFIFMPAICFLLVALFLIRIAHRYEIPPLSLLGGLVALWSLLLFLKAVFVKWTTELAVTNKRIIFKKGFISRDTMELTHAKIESIREEQGIIDRIFGRGTLVIEGTGGGKEYLKNIDDPMAFKKQAQSAADAISNPKQS